jgi:hypothetical protein
MASRVICYIVEGTLSSFPNPSGLIGLVKMKERSKFERAESKLSRQAQRVAEQQARVPAPDRLSEAITQYIEWHAFAYWARLIRETESIISDPLRQTLEQRCPGFLMFAAEYAKKHPKEPEFLWLRLIAWIDDQIFAFAKTEGWSDALSYFAARDQRMDKIFAYWQECDVTWKDERPAVLPRFEEWCGRTM